MMKQQALLSAWPRTLIANLLGAASFSNVPSDQLSLLFGASQPVYTIWLRLKQTVLELKSSNCFAFSLCC